MKNKYNNIPVIGSIPYLKTFKNVREKNKSILRKLNNIPLKDFLFIYKLLFSINRIHTIKTLSIISAFSNEGKSLINIILAKIFSLLNLKVLLIDGDVKRPQIHTRLNLPNEIGFSELLNDQKISIYKAIHHINSNFKVITSGKNNPDLYKKNFKQKNIKLFNKRILDLKDIDIIIYDLNPLCTLDLYAQLYREIDLLLMIVLENYLTDPDFERVLEKSLKRNLFIPGLILNSKNYKKYQNQL